MKESRDHLEYSISMQYRVIRPLSSWKLKSISSARVCLRCLIAYLNYASIHIDILYALREEIKAFCDALYYLMFISLAQVDRAVPREIKVVRYVPRDP